MSRRLLLALPTLFISLLAASASLAQDSTALTLEQCVARAVANSPRLQASRYTVRAADAAARESRAARWPTFGLGGNYNYQSEVQQLRIPLAIPGFTPPQIAFGDGNYYDFTATARVPLYTGGALTARTHVDASGYRAARQDFATDSLSLFADVRRAYYAALGAAAKLETARQNAQRLARYVEERTRAQQIGAASEEVIMLATSRLRQAESVVLMAEADVRTARFALGNLLATPGSEIIPSGNLDQSLLADLSPEASIGTLPEVTAIDARIEQSAHLARVSQSARLPSLSGNAAYHYAKPGVDAIANDWMDYYTLGLSASWTLWDWNSRAQRVASLRATTRALESRRESLTNALQTRHSSALAALGSARAAQAKLAQRLSLEQHRNVLVEGRKQQGMATESEYLDAQDDLSTAALDLAAATVRLRQAEADVLTASGR